MDQNEPHIQYRQSTGELSFHGADGLSYVLGIGWAGNGEGKNDPRKQDVRCVGPLPRGGYTIEAPRLHPKLGPFAMHLDPDESNEMFGRSDFYIHGASQDLSHRGQESMGCITADRSIREKIWSLAKRLQVVA